MTQEEKHPAFQPPQHTPSHFAAGLLCGCGQVLLPWASDGPFVKKEVIISDLALWLLCLRWGYLGQSRDAYPRAQVQPAGPACLPSSLPLSPLLEVQWLEPRQQVRETGAHSLWADQPWTLHLSNQAVLCGFLLGSAPCPQPGLWPWASPIAPPERFWEDIGGF